MKILELHITSKVPKQWQEQYSGACVEKGTGQLYFGWRGKPSSNMLFPMGNVMQKAIVVINDKDYDEVILHVEPEFTERKKAAKISIKLI